MRPNPLIATLVLIKFSFPSRRPFCVAERSLGHLPPGRACKTLLGREKGPFLKKLTGSDHGALTAGSLRVHDLSMTEHPAFHLLQFLLFLPWCARLLFGFGHYGPAALSWLGLAWAGCAALWQFPDRPLWALTPVALGGVFLGSFDGDQRFWSRVGLVCVPFALVMVAYHHHGGLPFFVSYPAMFWSLLATALYRAFWEERGGSASRGNSALWLMGCGLALVGGVLPWMPSTAAWGVFALFGSLLSLGAFLRNSL